MFEPNVPATMADSEDQEQALVRTLEGISLEKLKAVKHSKYVNKLVETIRKPLTSDSTQLILLVDELKTNPKPCYKRDTIVELLDRLINTKETTILPALITKPFGDCRKGKHKQALWKQLANCVASMPDLMANLGVTKKHPAFQKQTYYPFLVSELYKSLGCLAASKGQALSTVHKLFLLQLLGRVAMSSDRSQLVWQACVNKAICDEQSELKQLISSILTLPFQTHPDESDAIDDEFVVERDQISTTFEIFVDHLYLPIFYYLKPDKQNGDLIRILIGDGVIQNEYLKFIICDKALLKSNYNLDRGRQVVLLINIFVYLSSLVDHQKLCVDKSASASGNSNHVSLLIETLLEIVNNWSNGTKVLLRTYEHNRYLSMALLIAFKYAFEFDRPALVEHCKKIQSLIISAIPAYLNRASHEQRNLSMCLSELLLPKLHELMLMEQSNGGAKTTEGTPGDIDLKFDADFGDDLCQLQELFRLNLDDLYHSDLVVQDCNTKSDENAGEDNKEGGGKKVENTNRSAKAAAAAAAAVVVRPPIETRGKTKEIDSSTSGLRAAAYSTRSAPSLVEPREHNRCNFSKRVVELGEEEEEEDEDDDDEDEDDECGKNKFACETQPGWRAAKNSKHNDNADLEQRALFDEDDGADEEEDDEDEDDDDDDIFDGVGGGSASVPIYLHDCLNGLIENSSARFVRLCLIKLAELLNQMLDCQAVQDEKSLALYKQQLRDSRDQSSREVCATREPDINDTIRDVAIELTQVLYYLDDQYNIRDFEAHRLKALTMLCILAPDLVGKYLIEQMNGSGRGLMRQLEVLQVLVASAKHLSSATLDKQDKEKINRFAKYGPLYYHGIVYRLRSEVKAMYGSGALLTTRPETIVSNQSAAATTATTTTTTTTSRVSEDDDSYLLSRILFSTSSIMGCLSQQPVASRLATDLLDILAAYRCHPDPGVRSAIVACLKSVRDCTPSVYFRENLESIMVHLFGQWLSSELDTTAR